MSDLIERQEIIDRLDRVIEKGLVNIFSGEHPITAEVMKEVIMALPSAQPEIIRCKDCIKRDCCRTTNIWAVPPDDDWYCGDAERREDERNDI